MTLDGARPAAGQPPGGTPAWLAGRLRRLEEARGLDGVADALERLTAPLERAPALVSALRGDALGHALHPLLTDVPLGTWMSASCLDLGLGRSARRASTLLLGVGLVAALPTVASGVVEWRRTGGRSRRVGLAHAASNGAAFALYGASFGARLAGAHRAGVALALAGGAASTVGGYLGGHLSLVRKEGTADPALVVHDDGAA
ncbi:DUF2231 domain-containing protein [Miltoncostaea marina]|uniref:DUF2231 domain-containing protein n=1 Tax=Miltoncostaea marina TaxID=2843215 RepID=UPI001C3D049C|nr:DUF2231 domain-containing protein [Miltoncostaea marina]